MSTEEPKQVFFFGAGHTEGRADMREVLGGKGAGLAEMTRLSIPVPPGFTISAEVCHDFVATGRLPEGLREEVSQALVRLEEVSGKRFGDTSDPLLLSVRSGAAVSMPGMMDTILNLGLNEKSVRGLAETTQDPRFAFDAYRRFIQMYGSVVLGMNQGEFEGILEDVKLEHGVWRDAALTADALEQVCERFLELIGTESSTPFPQSPLDQLWGSIEAVFRSWKNPRAIAYRRLQGIESLLGTAVNVQRMVFGNLGEDSATGVAFTRHPSTGERFVLGEYLVNAQGEDVVAGIRTPLPISRDEENDEETLEAVMPEAYAQLKSIGETLEGHFRDVQDLEFTIERGTVWMLQTRTAKRTARAAIQVAIDMVEEGLIDKDTALLRVRPESLEQLLHPTIDPASQAVPLARGLPASPGAVSGEIVLSAEEAETRAARGIKVILVRPETSPEDIRGMAAAQGILTARGGLTSHAAVVARGMGKCCVAGCHVLRIDERTGQVRLGLETLHEGDAITLDGSKGLVYRGQVDLVEAEVTPAFNQLMGWADASRELGVRTNADNARDAEVALRLGAEGIGLCRTEHMFFESTRIASMQQLILARETDERRAALEVLEPLQREDFAAIFRVMAGRPVTIRLLDPPLHEFLPTSEEELEHIAQASGVSLGRVRAAVETLQESNPMLGHRGCRLGITYPEISEMQARALIDAALLVADEGIDVQPEIMVPLVGFDAELARLRALIEGVIASRLADRGLEEAPFPIKIGTMIELPRACLTAGAIAEHADFFSFGTNDLTQTTLGISRDDAGSFLSWYEEHGIIARDPFVSIDQAGVGRLMQIAVREGREKRPGMSVGICGEHGGESQSVSFCHKLGLDYVSCSPYRVPIARLAAAQATVLARREEAQL